MKKAISIALATAMLAACISCSNGEVGKQNISTDTTSNSVESESAPPVADEESSVEGDTDEQNTPCVTTPDISESESTTPTTEDSSPSPILFSNYDDILNAISKIAGLGDTAGFENEISSLDERERAIYQRLCSLTDPKASNPERQILHASFVDVYANGEYALRLYVAEGNDYEEKKLQETETFFVVRDGVPFLDDGTLLAKHRQMVQNHEHFDWRTIGTVLTKGEHYLLICDDFSNGRQGRTLYEIYDVYGNLAREGIGESDFHVMREGEILQIWNGGPCFYYSIARNEFSDPFYGYHNFHGELIAYVKDGILTVQNLFDKSLYYETYPEYRGVYSYYFSQDGKSLDFRHAVDGAQKDGTAVVCFEPLPIIRTNKICYIRTGPGVDCDVVMPSSGTYAYLRSATSDTARLLQEEPIIGGEYQSDDGTIRNDWYRISYHGKECYVSADSFTVEIYQPNVSQDEIRPSLTSDYDGVIALYKMAVEHLDDYYNAGSTGTIYAQGVLSEDEKTKALYEGIFRSAYEFYDERFAVKYQSNGQNCFGYAIIDLNQNGSEELLLMGDECDLIAVLGTVDGEVKILLDKEKRKYGFWIDANGAVHCTSQGDKSENYVFYRHTYTLDADDRISYQKSESDYFAVRDTCIYRNKNFIGSAFVRLRGPLSLQKPEIVTWEWSSMTSMQTLSIFHYFTADRVRMCLTMHDAFDAVRDGDVARFDTGRIRGRIEFCNAAIWLIIEDSTVPQIPCGITLYTEVTYAKG